MVKRPRAIALPGVTPARKVFRGEKRVWPKFIVINWDAEEQRMAFHPFFSASHATARALETGGAVYTGHVSYGDGFSVDPELSKQIDEDIAAAVEEPSEEVTVHDPNLVWWVRRQGGIRQEFTTLAGAFAYATNHAPANIYVRNRGEEQREGQLYQRVRARA